MWWSPTREGGLLEEQLRVQGVFVKISDFITFKGFLVEFLENKPS